MKKVLSLFGKILGFPGRLFFLHKITKPAPLRWVAKTLAGVLNVVVWLIIFILVGGLGPTVKYVGIPVANMVGVPAQIGSCTILPLGGYIKIEGLRVDNPTLFVEKDPSVYAKDPLVSINRFEFDLAMLSLLKREIRIQTVELEGTRFLYASEFETTNIDALVAQIVGEKAAVEAKEEVKEEVADVKEEVQEPKDADDEAEAFNIHIVHASISDTVVTVRQRIFGAPVVLPLPLPPLAMNELDGAAFMQKMDDFFAPVAKAIGTLGKGLSDGSQAIMDGAGSLIDGAGSVGSDVLQGAGELGGTAIEELGAGAEALGEGLKSLFK